MCSFASSKWHILDVQNINKIKVVAYYFFILHLQHNKKRTK